MKKLTLKYIENHFNKKGYVPRHNLKSIKLACQRIAKDTKYNSVDLFHLLIENKPIDGTTHNYGFQTAAGRFLVESIQSKYYFFEKKCNLI